VRRRTEGGVSSGKNALAVALQRVGYWLLPFIDRQFRDI